ITHILVILHVAVALAERDAKWHQYTNRKIAASVGRDKDPQRREHYRDRTKRTEDHIIRRRNFIQS
ncbi:hypothetical protein, partial [Pectobacterium brasiliense]|uniref:hypothetical protein n=1 Tax=Pectobacterium brasiliense TaxID=180957 RepID=UPI0019699845